MNKVAAYVSAGAIALVLLGTVVDISEPIPNNAMVYGDSIEKLYYGEPTIKNKKQIMHDNSMLPSAKKEKASATDWILLQSIKKITVSDAIKMGYKPDDSSKRNGDFVGETHSVVYVVLQRIGVFPKQPRWNKDGSWNW